MHGADTGEKERERVKKIFIHTNITTQKFLTCTLSLPWIFHLATHVSQDTVLLSTSPPGTTCTFCFQCTNRPHHILFHNWTLLIIFHFPYITSLLLFFMPV